MLLRALLAGCAATATGDGSPGRERITGPVAERRSETARDDVRPVGEPRAP